MTGPRRLSGRSLRPNIRGFPKDKSSPPESAYVRCMSRGFEGATSYLVMGIRSARFGKAGNERPNKQRSTMDRVKTVGGKTLSRRTAGRRRSTRQRGASSNVHKGRGIGCARGADAATWGGGGRTGQDVAPRWPAKGRERRGRKGLKKCANGRRGRVGVDSLGVGSVQNACNTKLARIGDGCRWFEGTLRIFGMRRALSRCLMMGSGEDTTDKIQRDGGCRLGAVRHGTFQHGPCAGGILTRASGQKQCCH